jgi:hypothetical protein
LIPLSLGNLVLAYAAALVLGLFLLSLVGWLTRGNRERRRRRRCIQCMFCGTIYEPSGAASLPECPQCARVNEQTPPPAI